MGSGFWCFTFGQPFESFTFLPDAELDFSAAPSGASLKTAPIDHESMSLKNKCRDIGDLEVEEINLDDDDIPSSNKKSASSSVFGMFKGLITQKELTAESMSPILEQYRYIN